MNPSRASGGWVQKAPKKSEKSSSQNRVCLVWKMFPHPWRHFLAYLELHSAHILKNLKISKIINLIKIPILAPVWGCPI